MILHTIVAENRDDLSKLVEILVQETKPLALLGLKSMTKTKYSCP